MRTFGALALLLALATACRREPATIASLTPREREALEFLRRADAFEYPMIGYGGVRARGYLAMRILVRSAAAPAAFRELVRSPSPAAQVYGLCGLYSTDPDAFAAELPRFQSSTAEVSLTAGRQQPRMKVARLACAEDGMRIPRSARSVEEWYAADGWRQRRSASDICGGRIPRIFTEREYLDEAAARRDEQRVDFRR